MRSRVRTALAAALFLAASASGAGAQVEVGAEVARDRALWHFDNPSSYDTADLVPHFFEQEYTLDNVWLKAGASYRAGIDWRTSVGFTPIRQARATDYDTFFNHGGVTWIAGTSGDARTRGFRFEQAVDLGRVGGVRLSGGYRVRVDRANFLDGDRTAVRNGTLVSRTTVTTREFTNGQLHEVFVQASRAWALAGDWEMRALGDITPAAVNRLAIQLPDKYPGQTLVFRTTNAVTTAALELARTGGGWPLAVSAAGTRSWNYSDAQKVVRTRLSAAITLGRAW